MPNAKVNRKSIWIRQLHRLLGIVINPLQIYETYPCVGREEGAYSLLFARRERENLSTRWLEAGHFRNQDT